MSCGDARYLRDAAVPASGLAAPEEEGEAAACEIITDNIVSVIMLFAIYLFSDFSVSVACLCLSF